MASSYANSSGHQLNGIYERTGPKLFAGQGVGNSITPISHETHQSPSLQYGLPGQQLNIMSPTSKYQQYYQGDFNTGFLKDPTQSQIKGYNKPFAPPSCTVSKYLGSTIIVGGAEGVSKSNPAFDSEKERTGMHDAKNISSIFTQKKYAFESSSSLTGNYFNIDKYFENFKDPLENINIAAYQNQTKTIPKGYTDYNNMHPCSQSTIAFVPQNNVFNTSPTQEEMQQQSRLIYDQHRLPSHIPASSINIGETTHLKRDKNKSLGGEYPNQNSKAMFSQPIDYSSEQERPSKNFAYQSNVNPQSDQQSNWTTVNGPNKESIGSLTNFDLTLPPFPQPTKTALQPRIHSQQPSLSQQEQRPLQHFQQKQPQNFLKLHHNAKGSQQQESQDKYPQGNEQDQQFKRQMIEYLNQETPIKGNILEQLEQKNNKTQGILNPFKQQALTGFEKTRSKMQSQQFLNRIAQDLDPELVYFIKFLIEQITIDSELDRIREEFIRSSEFSTQAIFNYFDQKKKGFIELSSLVEGLEGLSIPYIKVYIKRLFDRMLLGESKIMR